MTTGLMPFTSEETCKQRKTVIQEMMHTEEKKGIPKKATIDRKKNLRSHRLYWFGRRAQDIFFSALALIVLSPVLLITAIAIVIDDPGGSPIFTQDRVGRNGKLFKLYKFRSMCVDAEAKLEALLSENEMDGPVFKIKDDPRITRVGKFIRKISIESCVIIDQTTETPLNKGFHTIRHKLLQEKNLLLNITSMCNWHNEKMALLA